MNRIGFGIHVVVTGALVIGLIVQQVQIADLRASIPRAPELAAVRSSASPSSAAPLGPAERKAIEEAAIDAVIAAAPEGMAEEEVADLVASTVEEVLEAREAEQRDAAVDKWLDQASESTLVELEKVAADYDLPDAAVRDAHGLLVESLHYTVDLKQRVDDGTTSVRDAKLEGDAYLVSFGERMDDLLGVEASEALGEAIRPGRGWR